MKKIKLWKPLFMKKSNFRNHYSGKKIKHLMVLEYPLLFHYSVYRRSIVIALGRVPTSKLQADFAKQRS